MAPKSYPTHAGWLRAVISRAIKTGLQRENRFSEALVLWSWRIVLPGSSPAEAIIKKVFDENGIQFAFATVRVAGEGDAATVLPHSTLSS